MSARLVWKGLLFGLSILMLLLTMGYGGSYTAPMDTHTRYAGQAKIAKPGARLDDARMIKVVPDTVPEPEVSIFETIRRTTDRWMGGGNMSGAGQRSAGKTELQKLHRRGHGSGMATAVIGR